MCVLTGAGDWEDSWGGTSTYLSGVEGEEEGETLNPQSNALCLVLREEGSLAFVKHVSAQCPEARMDINVQYQLGGEEEEEE